MMDEEIKVPLAVQKHVATSDLYEFLTLFLQTPTQELFSGLKSGQIAMDLKAIFSELDWQGPEVSTILEDFAAIKEDIQEEKYGFSDLRSEHTRLFNHPKKPAIGFYEGVFLEERMPPQAAPPVPSKHSDIATKFQKEFSKMETSSLVFVNNAALDAERCYRQSGLKRTSDMNVPADCMFTEMAFMGFLHTQKAKALMEDDQAKMAETDAQLKEFIHLHIKKWARDFYRECQKESRYSLYQTVGRLGGLLSEDALALLDT